MKKLLLILLSILTVLGCSQTIENDNKTNVPVTGVTLNPATLTLKLKSAVTGQLNAEAEPLSATNRELSWSSGNDSVATVSGNGQVTATGAGNTIITVTTSEGGFSKTCAVTVEPADSIANGDTVNIIGQSGWLETLYVKWDKLGGVERYNVYYRGSGAGSWTKIDDPLIREYASYYRADVPGLKAGSYEVEVRPVNSSGDEFGTPDSVSGITVLAHNRSGFAFSGGKIPGAYNMDGTPKAGARIIYISEMTKETVTAVIMNDNNNKEAEFTGLQNILSAFEKGYESRPLIVRFIGKTSEKKNSAFSDNEGSVMIKGPSNQSRPNVLNGMNITLEGIGDDAVAYGWGIRTSRANSVEIRNMGFMLSNTSQKDAMEIQSSKYMWVHNCDFFYGQPGSASDQKKGDGALDVKESSQVTLSFNHFWDTGKSSLLGNSENEETGYLTYHHNWFDHSDSRHPRVRVHKVHIFNNYFDSIGKYGIGATLGSSVFSEANYFRNTKKPMLISMQGSDIEGGSGTFSSENGGMIKAYNNYMDAQSQAQYKPYSSTNTIEFDAYEAASAAESVPASVAAKKGGSTYDNDFLTYAYTADSPALAKEKVMGYAGRYWGGDFSFAFTDSDASHVDDPMPALLAALQSYTGKLVAIQGGGGNSGGSDDPDPPGPITGAIICSFGMTGSSGSSVFASNSAFTLTSANGTKPSGGATINGVTYNVALKLESSTIVSFAITEPMKLTLYTDAPNNNVGVNGANKATNAGGVAEISLETGSHTITRGSSGKNLWLIILEPVE